MMIKTVETLVTGDTSPDETTKVFTIHNFECVNPQCENYGKISKQEKILVYSKDK